MLTTDPNLDPLYSLAVAIQKQQQPDIQRSFSRPGHGVVPLPGGQEGNTMGAGVTPPDPGQLVTPPAFNPAFPPTSSTPPIEYEPLNSVRPPPRPMIMDQVPLIGDGGGAQLEPPLDPRDRPGFIGRMLPPGLRNGIVDAMTALAGSDPSAPGLNTLGQAFSSAQGSKQAREDRKLALTTAADDKAYERGRDTRQDTRADRSLALQERKAASDERKAALEEYATAAGIDLTQAQTAKIEREYAKGGLTTDQMIRLESSLNSFRNAKIKERQGPLTQVGLKPDQMAEVEKEVDAERKRLISSVSVGGGADTGGTGEVPETGVSGDGTWDAPITGANPHSLSPGHIFLAPPGSTYEGKDVSGQRFERQ